MLFREEKKLEDITEQDFQKWVYETEENANFLAEWLIVYAKTKTNTVGKAIDRLSRSKPDFSGYRTTISDNTKVLVMSMYEEAINRLWDDAKELSFEEQK